jgi:dienelactone hydrolase
MKILSSAMAIAILVFCSTLSPTLRAQVAPAAHDQAAPDTVAKAREVLNELVAGQFDKIEAQYDAAMKSALPPGKLGDTWKQLLGETGGFKGVPSASSQTIQSYQVATLACVFERTILDAVISFDADGTIGGIRFRPHKDTTPWSAPVYAKPDAFHEDSVTVKFQHWELPGTLTTPQGDGPYPLVVLVHGSGPHDADETIGPNKPFKDLAWGLASRGVAVLRYIKRTAQYGAKSVDDPASLTVDDEIVNDARAAVELAAKQPKIDAKRIFLLGHSEGGYVAPRIADGDPQIAGIILLAGSARPIEKLIIEQTRYLTSFPGVPADQAQKHIAAAEKSAATIESPDLKKTDTVDLIGAKIPATYFLDLRGYDPTGTAAKLKIRILVLQGGRDYQVTTEDFEAWKKSLDGHANATLKLYPDLNHLFQAGEGKSVPTEYDKAGHVSAETIGDIADWVAKGGNAK